VASGFEYYTAALLPFGAEYSLRPAWRLWERIYTKAFGLVDLPNRLRARIVLHELTEIGVGRILDFGCGTGCYSFYLSRNPRNQVCGLDVDESRTNDCAAIAARLARKNLTFTHRPIKNGLSLFHGAEFDIVLAIEVLTCVLDIKETLAEFHRILKEDGYLVGHIPVLTKLRRSETTLFTDENLTTLLKESGFENISISKTFGWSTRYLCKLFGWSTRSLILSAILFPLLLIVSSMCSVKSSSGEYRLFVARRGLGAPMKTVISKVGHQCL